MDVHRAIEHEFDEAQASIDAAAQQVMDGKMSEVPQEMKGKYQEIVSRLAGSQTNAPAVIRVHQEKLDQLLSHRISMAPAYVAHIERALQSRLSFDRHCYFDVLHRRIDVVADFPPDGDVLVIDRGILDLETLVSGFATVYLVEESLVGLLSKIERACQQYQSRAAVFEFLKEKTASYIIADFRQLMGSFPQIPASHHRTCAAALRAHLARNHDDLFTKKAFLEGLNASERRTAHALCMQWLTWIMEDLHVPNAIEPHSTQAAQEEHMPSS